MEFHVIIPARYESTRLPGKVLADIAGKPMLQHVYERAVDSGAENVLIATDHEKVAAISEGFGARVCMTASHHQTGTERLAEAVGALEADDDAVVVCVQADEPLIPIPVINQVAENLIKFENIKVATICEPIADTHELFDPNSVKVVFNRRNHAMYFSRAPIPWEIGRFDPVDSSASQVKGPHYRHIGIYAYRVGFLEDFVGWTDCQIETMESLEQLRMLWNGVRIHIGISKTKFRLGLIQKRI